MKRTITAILGFAFLVSSAVLAQAQNAGDDIFFSTSNTDPGATVGDLPLTVGSTGTQTLYVWITMAAGGADDVTPPDTGFSGPGNTIPNTGAGLAVNYNTSNAAVATLTGASVLNPTLTGSSPATKRWDQTTTFSSSGTSTIYNINAVTVPVQTPAGIMRGLSQTNIGGVSDPNVVAHTYSNGAANAFLLGSISVNVLGAGSTIVAVQPSNQVAAPGVPAGLQIAKGQAGSGTSTIMTNFFTYHTATLTLAVTGRLGDLNGDNAINAADIDIIATDLRNNTTHLTPPTEDLNGDNVVNTLDYNHEVGTLVDIAGGGAGGLHGTHFGDANLDQKVSFADFQILQNNFGTQTGASFGQGDFNGDAKVTFADFQILQNNFGSSGPGGFAPVPGAAVPEPASLALCGIGLVGLIGLRRRFSCN